MSDTVLCDHGNFAEACTMCKMIHRLAQAEKERDNVKSNWNEARKLEADLAKAFAEIADLKAKLAEVESAQGAKPPTASPEVDEQRQRIEKRQNYLTRLRAAAASSQLPDIP